MIFYDFEVFKHDWLAVFIDMTRQEETVVVNDPVLLTSLYESNTKEIWTGYNNRHYDQYIFKGILLGMDPKEINDWIIIRGKEGWQFSNAFREIRMTNYDVMPNPPVGLKTMEGFMGSDIRETEVPFDIDRKLTEEEIQQTIHYCRHDVEETIKVFLQKIDDFNAMYGIVKAFGLPLARIGDSEARITANVLGCRKNEYCDEFDFQYLPCLDLGKYGYVKEWFEEKRIEARTLGLDSAFEQEKRAWYKQQSLTVHIARVPHTFGFGGVHGAPVAPCHFDRSDGAGYHVDVNNYYPSMLIAWDLVTRSASNENYTKVYNTRKQLKIKQMNAKTKEEKKKWKKAQLPYKKMLNALSGAMKDPTNAAYDPRNNNTMCINGQLMLLDLIAHLEVIPGFKLVQSNTDGLIVWIPDTDEAFATLDDICYEWECRCSTPKCEIKLALDSISEIYQKDVNNYLWIDSDGNTERIGSYVKELSDIDYDLPIVNKAVVDYMSDKTPVRYTVERCNDFRMFQKIVKLSNKYRWVELDGDKYIYKCYRVFASNDDRDGRLLKCGGSRGKPEKFANTPDHCRIYNANLDGLQVPRWLDRQWYIDLAEKRLGHFGVI